MRRGKKNAFGRFADWLDYSVAGQVIGGAILFAIIIAFMMLTPE